MKMLEFMKSTNKTNCLARVCTCTHRLYTYSNYTRLLARHPSSAIRSSLLLPYYFVILSSCNVLPRCLAFHYVLFEHDGCEPLEDKAFGPYSES